MGLAYVAPIGVQNLFVIHSALAHPRRRALATAGIVIFFDVTLALACFFGVGVVMETFPVVRMAVLLAGPGHWRGSAPDQGGGGGRKAPPCHRVQNGVHRLCGHLVQSPGAH